MIKRGIATCNDCNEIKLIYNIKLCICQKCYQTRLRRKITSKISHKEIDLILKEVRTRHFMVDMLLAFKILDAWLRLDIYRGKYDLLEPQEQIVHMLSDLLSRKKALEKITN